MRRLSFLAAFLALAPACAELAPPDAGEERDALRIATTIYPFAWLAEQVAPLAEVTLLAGHGAADPHDAELTPGELRTLRRADVVVHVGRVGYQPQVERALDDIEGVLISALDVVDPLPLAEPHDHADDEGDDAGLDPHVWQSPSALGRVGNALAAELTRLDPDHPYEANAASTARLLADLEEEIDRLLSDCEHDTAVLSHAGFAYMLDPRGIHQRSLTGAAGHGEPSPRRMTELAQMIRAEEIPAVVTEPVEGRPGAEALAREAGVPLLTVHPLGAVGAEEAGRGYPALVRENATAFAGALACSGSS